jgi:glutamyl-tRNA reductase
MGLAGSKLPALAVIGVSHRGARLDVRERLHLTPAEAATLARELAADGEAVVLSTCNRTEVYLEGDGLDRARELLERRAGLTRAELEAVLEIRVGAEAVEHLLRVAAGLDSQLPGEAQILGQVREAYELARAAGATGAVLNRLFEHALHTGKRVRAETGLGTTPAAVPAAAAALAREVVGELAGRRVLVIGAGKMGQLTATSFMAAGAERIFVANHRLERAEELAARFDGEAVPFDRIEAELARADVVVSSTRCPQVILRANEVRRALVERESRPLVLIDIAVPRDLDPAIAELDGCVLFDLDALGSVGLEATAVREQATRRAETIAAQEAKEFMRWLAALEAVPVVAALRRRADEIRIAELERAETRLGGLSADERERVELLTTQIVNKLLHEPTVRAKDDGEYAAALSHLFALER